MRTFDTPSAGRRRLQHIVVVLATVLAASVAATHPASAHKGEDQDRQLEVSHNTARPLHLTVEPASLVINEPMLVPPPVSNTSSAVQGSGVGESLSVWVPPGTAQWSADTNVASPLAGTTRILSGTVLYALGDNRPWKLVAHINGVDEMRVQPSCESTYAQLPGTAVSAVAGQPVIVGDEPVLVCSGVSGNSSGLFSVALDVVGQVSGNVSITVELTH
ncbi:MAG: hypothetical protein WCK14_01125 [Actinomycetota bacterium]